MPRPVEINIYKIAQTRVDEEEVSAWLNSLGAGGYAEEILDADVEFGDASTLTSDPSLLVALAAKRCYMSFEPGHNPNVTKVRKDLVDYFDNILKSGHGSVLEHAVFTFAIENVSRVFTAEMNRHRAGVGISEGSMRFIRYTDIPYWLPGSIKLTEEEKWALDEEDRLNPLQTEAGKELFKMAQKKLQTQQLFTKAFTQDEENYKEAQEIWKEELSPESKFHGKKQVTSMMRRIIPMGVATGGVWTMNARALRHVITMRASEAAEEEMIHVFSRIAKIMVDSEPRFFGDFGPVPGTEFWKPKYPKV